MNTAQSSALESGVPAHTPTDRELLEAAAKAGGIAGTWVNDFGGEGCDGILYEHAHGGQSVWSPLTDDGDKWRLAVKLGFSVDFNFGIVRSATGEILAVNEHDIGRAIVRAAAAIARATAAAPAAPVRLDGQKDAVELAHRLNYAAYAWGFEAGKVGQHVDTTIAQHKADARLAEAIAAVQAMAQGVEKDAATDAKRLDWLERHFTDVHGVYVAADHTALPFAVDCEDDTFNEAGNRIRAAIDAARASQENNESTPKD